VAITAITAITAGTAGGTNEPNRSTGRPSLRGWPAPHGE
jgi:hypothetical protein